jgi:hypothetical protein
MTMPFFLSFLLKGNEKKGQRVQKQFSAPQLSQLVRMPYSCEAMSPFKYGYSSIMR